MGLENGFHQWPSEIVDAEGGRMVKMPAVFLLFEKKIVLDIQSQRLVLLIRTFCQKVK